MTVATDWQRVADALDARVRGVDGDAWENPTPCDGWVARDIVRHLVDWVPAFLSSGAAVDLGAGPDVDVDPVAAWQHLDRAIRTLLADNDVSARRFMHPRAGSHALDEAIAMFVLGDVLIHTWDLARATGQDETLDATIVRAQLAGLETIDEASLVASGHYGPRVPVADGTDEQTRLLALTGRQP